MDCSGTRQIERLFFPKEGLETVPEAGKLRCAGMAERPSHVVAFLFLILFLNLASSLLSFLCLFYATDSRLMIFTDGRFPRVLEAPGQ